MKKIAVFVVVLGSMCVINAMDHDYDSLALAKKNSTIPGRNERLCCPLFGAQVPPCVECAQKRNSVGRTYMNAGESLRSERKLSDSQELRRCP